MIQGKIIYNFAFGAVSYTHLVMAGAPAGAAEEEELTLEQAAQRAFALTIEGFSASAAAKPAAQMCNRPF